MSEETAASGHLALVAGLDFRAVRPEGKKCPPPRSCELRYLQTIKGYDKLPLKFPGYRR